MDAKNKILKKLIKHNSKTYLLVAMGIVRYSIWAKNQAEWIIKINKSFKNGDKQSYKLTSIRIKRYSI